MILSEINAPPQSALPLRAFADHLRLGSGFEDDGAQDAVLELYLRTSMAVIEARLGIAMLARRYSWTVTGWRQPSSQGLPIRPVQRVEAIKLLDAAGTERELGVEEWALMRDDLSPRIIGNPPQNLPVIPRGGYAEIILVAGYGAAWADIPLDLQQAIFMLATYYYENRLETETVSATIPFGVLALIEGYRSLRLGGRAA